MIVEISVVPKSGRFLVLLKDGKVKIYLKSAAEDNKANLELLKEIEKLLGKGVRVQIVSGHKSRHKKLGIGVSEEVWESFLKNYSKKEHD